jgi:hypothetical protein
MPRLTIEDKIEIMEMVSRITGEAVKHPETARDLDLQLRMVEELYRTMTALVEEDEDELDEDEDED